jgi:hypothetical protein
MIWDGGMGGINVKLGTMVLMDAGAKAEDEGLKSP